MPFQWQRQWLYRMAVPIFKHIVSLYTNVINTTRVHQRAYRSRADYTLLHVRYTHLMRKHHFEDKCVGGQTVYGKSKLDTCLYNLYYNSRSGHCLCVLSSRSVLHGMRSTLHTSLIFILPWKLSIYGSYYSYSRRFQTGLYKCLIPWRHVLSTRPVLRMRESLSEEVTGR
jgi:hypothetical protein